MGLYAAVVVGYESCGFSATTTHTRTAKTEPRILLRADSQQWWEPIRNVYEVTSINKGKQHVDYATDFCQGIRTQDFPGKGEHFARLCEIAMDERGRLNAMTLNVASSKKSILLHPNIVGFRAYTDVHKKSTTPLHHAFLRQKGVW